MYACSEAKGLGLAGWVRNLADGRVEVFACGEIEPLEAFIAWLHRGPRQARVAHVQVEEAPPERCAGFVIR